MKDQIGLFIDRNSQRQVRLRHNLETLKIELHEASTVRAAKKMIEKHSYHLIIMHFDTIGKEVFRFCSFIRSLSSQTKLIVLMTKVNKHVEEQLFDCGVNDVVVGKQTSAGVLTKRIRARLCNSRSSWTHIGTIRLKNTIIDFDRREVRRDGSCYQLRGILADLLKYFLDNSNHVISRDELQKSYIWVDSICTPPNEGGKTFDVNIGKLRKIIEPDPTRPQIIKSVRGIGWKLTTEEKPTPELY
jgi:two-component system alkaline phosphatase synthesis response regulator PhoP